MDYDIGIVGGGLVGLMAATVFSQQGRRVRLVEARPFAEQASETMEVRSLALSLSSINMLRSVGQLSGLSSALTPIRDIHISSKGYLGVTQLHAEDLGIEALGQVVEYPALQQQLLQAAEQDPNIDLSFDSQFESLQQFPDHVDLTLRQAEDRHSLSVGVLLVADGAMSQARDMLGVNSEVHDYQQSAIIANVEVAQPRHGWAYERFTGQGPLALLPLGETHYSLVWTRQQREADTLMELDDRSLLDRIQQDFGYRLGKLIRLGRRDRFKLALRQSSRLVVGRCVLIGNAANTLHPVAGQGFNLALRDIGQLHDQLQHVDLSDTAIDSRLESYEQSRRADQKQTITLGHGLVSLFSNDFPLLGHARGAGLTALGLLPPARRAFSWAAMGFGAGVNSLMRGE